jgi:hypothetical protein
MRMDPSWVSASKWNVQPARWGVNATDSRWWDNLTHYRISTRRMTSPSRIASTAAKPSTTRPQTVYS